MWRNVLIFITFLLVPVDATIHTLTLKNDGRRNFPLSTFGFYPGGKLAVSLSNFSFDPPNAKSKFGFTLQKTKNDGAAHYTENIKQKCILEDESLISDMEIILLTFNIENKKILIKRYGTTEYQKINIEAGLNGKTTPWTLKEIIQSHLSLVPITIEKGSCLNNDTVKTDSLDLITNSSTKKTVYSSTFTVHMDCHGQEGLYNLYFHNCAGYRRGGDVTVNFKINMFEQNMMTFLSAGEIPLPIMYGFMSCMFFIIACVWICFLKKYRGLSYKIHWLMAALVYIKSVSLAFHAVNFYYTGVYGLPVKTWEIIYYMIHLLKGALLFTTIVLIGTGYFFVKHVLSKKEKNLFMIVIPLQIIANVAQIIIESTEEGDASYQTWHSQITIGVDLLCCGAILLPVVWSIKHLSEAAKTDGKAAISLQKLKLFRHFYVTIVVYIYFTRIVVYLIKVMLPFQYMWLDEFFTEVATFFFFVLTGYKFRPVNNNPYLHLPQEDEDGDIEMNDISSQSAYGERLHRVNKVDVHVRNT